MTKIRFENLKRNKNETDRQYYARLAAREKELSDKMNEPEAYDEVVAINNIFYEYPKLINFTYQYLLQNYSTYMKSNKSNPNNDDDIVNRCWQEIFKNIKNYTEDIDITTFIKRHIQHGAREFIESHSEISSYYGENISKINKVISELMAEGYDETEITEARIQEKLPQLTIKQIHEAMEVKKDMKRESFNPDYEGPSTETPEEVMLQEETRQNMMSLLKELLPHQQYILLTAAGEIDKTKEYKIARDDDYRPSYAVRERQRMEALCIDSEYIHILKENGYSHYIYKDNNKEYIPADKLRILYAEAQNAAKSTSIGRLYSERKNEMANISISEEIELNNSSDALEVEDMLIRF